MNILFSIISPTWLIAYCQKKGKTQNEIRKGIVLRNYSYLIISFVSLLAISYLDTEKIYSNCLGILLSCAYVYMLPLSRSNEIFISFIQDAIDKTSNKKDRSTLTYSDRIALSLRSYVELIFNYAAMYLIMPKQYFGSGQVRDVIDAIYFSGVTITTLGYGDISPKEWAPKLLVVHEVLCGFTLLIVSFAIYVGKSGEKRSS